MTALDRVLASLEARGGSPRRVGDGWEFRCPSHKDRKPSGSLALGPDGKVLMHCHAGCDTKNILASIGLSFSDLFETTESASRRQVAAYDYTDEDGRLLYQVLRYEPKDFRARRPDGNGGWIWNLRGTRRVLFRLPAVLDAVREGRTIHICAGEKDAEAVNAANPENLAYVATTAPGGEGRKKWKPSYTDSLRGAARVVIWRDRDRAGRAHAAAVRDAIAPFVNEVLIVEARTGKDAYDHLAAGYTLEDTVVIPGDAVSGEDEDPQPDDRGQAGDPTAAQESIPAELPERLTPGGHVTDDGEYVEIGNDDFVGTVVEALPPGAVYRRGSLIGTLDGDVGHRIFEEANDERIRIVTDTHVRLVRWTKPRRSSEIPKKVYVPTGRDHSRLIRAGALTSRSIRNLSLLTSYPVVLGSDYRRIHPGWNEDHDAFYDEPPSLEGIGPIRDPRRIHEILDDLVVDFPFKDQASRENFFGLLLTPLIRTAIPEANIPLHLVMASLERTGKGKLASETLGGVILGRTAPVMPWAGSEEERDKRVTALLKRGDTIAVIDNLDTTLTLDSSVLAALLTSRRYTGRLLGKSEMVDLPNTLTLVATGNNVRCSGEIAKRTIPIILQPKTDHPEARTDFKHPDVVAHVARVRLDVLGALHGMIENWKARPVFHDQPMGGFDTWSRVCGGILLANGFTAWRTNFDSWVRHANPEGEDLRAFVNAWADRWPDEKKSSRELVQLAEELGVFPWVQKSKSEAGKAVSLSKSVLRKAENRPVGSWVVRSSGSGSNSLYFLEENRL